MKDFTKTESGNIVNSNNSNPESIHQYVASEIVSKSLDCKRSGVLLYGGNASMAEIVQRISAVLGAVLITIPSSQLRTH